ncbi:hypothetical protein [Parvularcula sp. LCG005]|uniref:hypothetical protein n=1 Tax=Parvularcula sp. LCG005 TaxID=3078805 RepID=UPI00294366A0|nr:hypothetical protein [Parvularcula sp. LCG005]WOI53352.1 hypothetical protein RUI03_14500 [Parvularcula sp. LCG005]
MSHSLTPDCDQCAALCCVALAIDKGQKFSFDKAAGTPCQHLDHHRCSIHDVLTSKGCSGCVDYQCDGAGQRVIQELFEGRSWQEDSALLTPMMRAFADVRAVHAQLVLLREARKLSLSPAEETRATTLEEALNHTVRYAPERRGEAIRALVDEVAVFLRTLAPLVRQRTRSA